MVGHLVPAGRQEVEASSDQAGGESPESDLVDEFVLIVFPVLLGTGKRLFGDGTIPRGLRLTDAQTFPTGVTAHTYERVGEPEYGTVGA